MGRGSDANVQVNPLRPARQHSVDKKSIQEVAFKQTESPSQENDEEEVRRGDTMKILNAIPRKSEKNKFSKARAFAEIASIKATIPLD